jgi:Cell division protein
MRGDGMAHFAKLVSAAVLSLACVGAHAGYAQVAPPPGWSAGSGGVGGLFNGVAAGNSAQFLESTVRTNAALNVGGRAVSIPSTLRFAANAPRFAAAAIFANPYVRIGVGIASWLGLASIIWDAVNNQWVKITDVNLTEGIFYRQPFTNNYYSSPDAACNAFAAANSDSVSDQFVYMTGNNYYCGFYNKMRGMPDAYTIAQVTNCPAGAICKGVGTKPITDPEEFKDYLAPLPMPQTVPKELDAPLPVELPEMQPVFVPTGNPVQNPNYNPDAEPSPQNKPWLQPAVRVVPAPTPENPWQVDLQPVDRPVDSGEPSPDPKVEPLPDPNSPPDPNKPKDQTKEETPDFCAQHPEALACAKLDTPPDTDLPTSEKSISVTPDSGWGADNATCPQPRVLHVQGQEIPIPFDLFCMYMQGLRPIILAMAWLSAAFILVGARESS